MKKRIIALALCLVMLLGCLGMSGDVLLTPDENAAPEVTTPADTEVTDEVTAPVDDTSADAEDTTDIAVDEELPVLNCANFTNVAPLMSAQSPVRKMLARTTEKAGTDNASVETSKTVTKNDNGTYTLRLETYVTGFTQTVVTQKPTDIVLVLDTSGSMNSSTDILHPYNHYIKVADKESVAELNPAYANYYKWWNGTEYRDMRYYNGVWQYDAWGIGENWKNCDKSFFGDEAGITKINALKIAANEFIDSTADKNGDNQIAIVTYADNSNIRNQLTPVPAGATALKSTINGLTANGATAADDGMKDALAVIKGIPENRDSNKVVVFFTDGEPNHRNGFDETVANTTVNYSKQIKDKGATVYSIGVVEGADPTNDTKNINKYLHRVSSNYLDATTYQNGTLNPNASPFNGGKSYYLSADNLASLQEIFENISDEVGGASIKLDSNTVVKDVISDYFKLPAGTVATKIKVMTADCTAVDNNGKPTSWGEDKVDNSLKPIVDMATKTVSVSGYDFSEHWVGKNKTDNNIHEGAQKLIIEIPIEPEDGFLGGNNVPTNADTSGVYSVQDGEQKLVENYEVPTANVPIKLPELEAKDANVYYGGNVPDSSDLYKAYTIADKMGDFVNITYALDKTVSNTADGTYTITATAEPKYDGYGAEGTPATAKTATATANVYVFKPEITYRDSAIDLGQTPNYNSDNFVKVEWKHGSDVAVSSKMIGTEPTLSYVYDPAADSADAFKTDTYVNVTVKIGNTDITNTAVTFKHEDCTYDGCAFDKDEGQFIVHIKTFDLTITKAGWNNIDKDQSFVFNIVCEDKNINMIVVIVGNDSVTIKGLPVGTYTITEDAGWSWRYELNAVNAAGSTGTCTETDNGCTYTPSGTNNSIVFTNSRIQQQWLSFVNNVKNVFQ